MVEYIEMQKNTWSVLNIGIEAWPIECVLVASAKWQCTNLSGYYFDSEIHRLCFVQSTFVICKVLYIYSKKL